MVQDRLTKAWWTQCHNTITEGPDDKTAALATLGTVMAGNVASVSLKAFNEEEFAQIVARLP